MVLRKLVSVSEYNFAPMPSPRAEVLRTSLKDLFSNEKAQFKGVVVK
jgi:hypothetical protein